MLGSQENSDNIVLGVRGSMEQGSQLRPVPVRKPACRLAGTIKPPFCETTSASTREGNNTPKIGSINSFSKSEFANPHHLKGLANSNHVLSAFTVPLLPGAENGPSLTRCQ